MTLSCPILWRTSPLVCMLVLFVKLSIKTDYLVMTAGAHHAFACQLLIRLHQQYTAHLQPSTPAPGANSATAPATANTTKLPGAQPGVTVKPANMKPTLNPESSGSTSRLLLQPFIMQWISSSSSTSSSSASSSSSLSSPVRSASSSYSKSLTSIPFHACDIASFIITLMDGGLFCPVTYLERLVSQGLLRPPPSADQAAVAVANQHRRVLRHLPPLLPWFSRLSSGQLKGNAADNASDTAPPSSTTQHGTSSVPSPSCMSAPAVAAAIMQNVSWGETASNALLDLLHSAAAGRTASPPTLIQQQQNVSSSQGSMKDWCAARWSYASARKAMLRMATASCSTPSTSRSKQQTAGVTPAASSSGRRRKLTHIDEHGSQPAPKRCKRDVAGNADSGVGHIKEEGVAVAGPGSSTKLVDVMPAVMHSLGLAAQPPPSPSHLQQQWRQQQQQQQGQQHQQMQQQPQQQQLPLRSEQWADHTGTPITAIKGLRPWEKTCLADAVFNGMLTVLSAVESPTAVPDTDTKHTTAAVQAGAGGATASLLSSAVVAGSSNANLPLHCGDVWLQRGVASLIACDAAKFAVQLLLPLLATRVNELAAQLQPLQPAAVDGMPVGPQTPDQHETLKPSPNTSFGCILTCLDAVQDTVVAMDLLSLELDICTQWALSSQVEPRSARLHLGRVLQHAGVILATRLDTPGVKSWWGGLQSAQPDTQQGRHWLVGDLQSFVSTRGDVNSAGSANGFGLGSSGGSGGASHLGGTGAGASAGGSNGIMGCGVSRSGGVLNPLRFQDVVQRMTHAHAWSSLSQVLQPSEAVAAEQLMSSLHEAGAVARHGTPPQRCARIAMMFAKRVEEQGGGMNDDDNDDDFNDKDDAWGC